MSNIVSSPMRLTPCAGLNDCNGGGSLVFRYNTCYNVQYNNHGTKAAAWFAASAVLKSMAIRLSHRSVHRLFDGFADSWRHRRHH